MNGNAISYEEQLYGLKEVSNATGANIMNCNYRGVMESQGSAQSSRDLQRDGEAMIQFLLEQGIPPDNILVHGWSLGGAVATSLVKLYQDKGIQMHLCSDRSFSSFPDFLKNILPKCLVGIITKIVAAAGWVFNASNDFNQIVSSKFIIHAKRADRVIPYEASVYKQVKKTSKPTNAIKIQPDPLLAHKQKALILENLTFQMSQFDVGLSDKDQRAVARKLNRKILCVVHKLQNISVFGGYNPDNDFVSHKFTEKFIEKLHQKNLINDEQKALLKSETLVSDKDLKEIMLLQDWTIERVSDSLSQTFINFHASHLTDMGPYFLTYVENVKNILNL